LGFFLIAAVPRGCTFNAEYYRDNILAALTQFQRTTGGNLLFMLTMQLLKKIELSAKKMDCGELPIYPTHLISHHPTSFFSVMSRNVSKEWRFDHTRNYSTQLVKW
jgi:hypothetical protein